MTALRRRYGASPWHLAAHLAGLGAAALALERILGGGGAGELIGLYAGLAIAHDLVLVPAYTALDGLARRRLPVRGINHLRAPALISGLLLVVYGPEIGGRGAAVYLSRTGHPRPGYLGSWALITAGLFAGSAVIYAIRVLRPAADHRPGAR